LSSADFALFRKGAVAAKHNDGSGLGRSWRWLPPSAWESHVRVRYPRRRGAPAARSPRQIEAATVAAAIQPRLPQRFSPEVAMIAAAREATC
jgi:hypothetical protein